MAFWSQADFKEPLRANKWYIEFTSILKDARFALKECKKPSYKVSETKHRCFNYVVNLPGTVTWDPINIKFASVRGKTTSRDSSVLLYNVLRNGGSQTPKTFLESTLSKTRMHNALETGLLNIIQVDSEGAPIEVWSLYNAYISVANFGSLSYDNENIVDIDCTITYDWAELNNQERAARLGITTSDPVPPELPSSEQQPEIEPLPPPEQPVAEQPAAEQPLASADGIVDPMSEPPLASADGIVDPMSVPEPQGAANTEARPQPQSDERMVEVDYNGTKVKIKASEAEDFDTALAASRKAYQEQQAQPVTEASPAQPEPSAQQEQQSNSLSNLSDEQLQQRANESREKSKSLNEQGKALEREARNDRRQGDENYQNKLNQGNELQGRSIGEEAKALEYEEELNARRQEVNKATPNNNTPPAANSTQSTTSIQQNTILNPYDKSNSSMTAAEKVIARSDALTAQMEDVIAIGDENLVSFRGTPEQIRDKTIERINTFAEAKKNDSQAQAAAERLRKLAEYEYQRQKKK